MPSPSIENSIVAGSASGFASTLLVYPLDLIRTKLQASSMSSKPPSTLQLVRPMLSSPSLFYTGLSIPLASQVLYKSTIFTTMSLLQTKNDSPFVNGCIAGGANALVFVTPTEYIRNNVIVNGASFRTFKGLSILAMYRGATWSVLRDVVGCGGFFSSSSFISSNFPTVPAYVKGAVAGVAFWTLALPLDSIKTLVQVERSKEAVYEKVKKNPGRLFNSWGVAFARGIPGAASTIFVFEMVSEWLEGG